MIVVAGFSCSLHAGIKQDIEVKLGLRFGNKALAKKIVDSIPQFQTEESLLRKQCNKIATHIIYYSGSQARQAGLVKANQVQYLKNVGTPVALRLLAELLKTTYGF